MSLAWNGYAGQVVPVNEKQHEALQDLERAYPGIYVQGPFGDDEVIEVRRNGYGLCFMDADGRTELHDNEP